MADVLELVTGAWVARSVTLAAELGLADLLAGGPLGIEALALASGTRAAALLAMMRVLAGQGVFAETQPGHFANNEGSARLRSDHPMSMRSFCQLAGTEYTAAWGHLGAVLREETSGFAAEFGGSVYDYLDAHPQRALVYHRAMAELTRPVGMLLAQSGLFAGDERVVDIGGGGGELLRQLLAVHPGLSATCFDRTAPDASDGAVRHMSGDFFAAVPAGADMYLLKNVLHNWNDTACAALLGVIARAMRTTAGARLLVLERPVNPQGASPSQALNGLLQMVICQPGTVPRSEAQLQALFAGAGLAGAVARRLPSGHTVFACTLAAAQEAA